MLIAPMPETLSPTPAQCFTPQDTDALWKLVTTPHPVVGKARHLGEALLHAGIISAYFPSGSSGEERQQAKFRFLDTFHPHLMAAKGDREFILSGDINIAHQPIDLKNWRSNQKNSGFLPEERAWMTKLLHTTDPDGGLVDVYRQLQPTATDTAYTWWSNRGQAYANNVGWRLDYHLATPALAALARTEHIYKDEKFSDHAPITVDYDFTL